MRWMVLSICAVVLVGCDLLPEWAVRTPDGQPVATPVETPPPASGDVGVDTPDTRDTAEDETTAAPAPEVSVGTLGRTIASLGNAAEPGLWLKTPLVTAEQRGRVYYAQTNTTVDVTLIPIEGPDTAGSRLSLAAMQALGAPLTGLPEVDVFAG
ncbi:hypothetical protein [uncultured Tateyamaria sp.]|uniref:hypothetical protein n=1 Tax=uncultured Tateyamaria sp. TaxID=455651 RepID=UPI002622528C|nr:hypothetical protein [uncultured Tateyamaria sp.]